MKRIRRDQINSNQVVGRDLIMTGEGSFSMKTTIQSLRDL